MMAKPYGRDLFSRLRTKCRQCMWVAGTSSQESQPTQEALAVLESSRFQANYLKASSSPQEMDNELLAASWKPFL